MKNDVTEARVADAPRADEILVALAVTDSGRPLPRVGGLTAEDAVGEDGLLLRTDAEPHRPPRPLADLVKHDFHAELLQHLSGDTFALADQTEQDVLGSDVVVIQEPGLFLSQDNDPSGPVGETLEQGWCLLTMIPRLRAEYIALPRQPVGPSRTPSHGSGEGRGL